MIAKLYKNWCNFAELREPRSEALEISILLDSTEGVNSVAGNNDIIWLFLTCLLDDGIKRMGSYFATKMNVANEKEFKLMFDVLIIETIARIVEAFHLCVLYNIQSRANKKSPAVRALLMRKIK